VVYPPDGRCTRSSIGKGRRSNDSGRKNQEGWYQAEINRIAGEIALKSPDPDAAKAETYFEGALAVALQQQAKSWQLRAAMSLARLWRDIGKRRKLANGLRVVYGGARDLKEAKALLEELGGVRPEEARLHQQQPNVCATCELSVGSIWRR
jgi:predicted ATPase